MDHYLDIVVRPAPELAAHQAMSALYARLHRALAGPGSRAIGVSFPDFGTRPPTLGSRLRLHGALPALAHFGAPDWLAGVRDHVDLGAVLPVPPGAGHRNVRRVQAKSSPDRMRRRLMRRHDIDAEEAGRRIPDSAAESLGLPFVQLVSASTGHPFRLFIDHRPIQPAATPGGFNAYGLSQEATVPWF